MIADGLGQNSQAVAHAATMFFHQVFEFCLNGTASFRLQQSHCFCLARRLLLLEVSAGRVAMAPKRNPQPDVQASSAIFLLERCKPCNVVPILTHSSFVLKGALLP